MGVGSSKTKTIDECTSNSSLSNLRYIITERSKWKVFRKKDVTPIPVYPTALKPVKGCPCGNKGPCKQKITPNGVTIHYPQKKKKFTKFSANKSLSSKPERGYISPRPPTRVKVIRQKKFPTWRLDKICYRPTIITPRPYR